MDEYQDSTSSVVVTVLESSMAPTVMALGSLAGLSIDPNPVPTAPSLPAATTTTIPALYAARTALQRGSVEYDSYTGWPSDRFRTRML